jgi:hypothetical protein
MHTEREKFSSQADPLLLGQIRDIAHSEGRQLQFILEEAMRDYIAKKKATPRPEVLQALEDSTRQFDYLYKKLAE